jgi:hypothetical protein
MIEAFLDHLRVERRLAAHTLESYARDLGALAAYATPPTGSRRRSIARLGASSVSSSCAAFVCRKCLIAPSAALSVLVLIVTSSAALPMICNPPRAWLRTVPVLEQADALRQLMLDTRLACCVMIEVLCHGHARSELISIRRSTPLDEHYELYRREQGAPIRTAIGRAADRALSAGGARPSRGALAAAVVNVCGQA